MSTLKHSEEKLDSLKDCIDKCFNRIVMGKTNQTPSTSKITSRSKRSHNKESPRATSSIGPDYPVSTPVCPRLKFYVGTFRHYGTRWSSASNRCRCLLWRVRSSESWCMTQIYKENKRIKETVIDLQACSMRDNLVFFGIPGQADEDPKLTIKDLIKNTP